VAGLVTGEALTDQLRQATFNDKNVGQRQAVSAAPSTLGRWGRRWRGQASNYQLSSGPTTFSGSAAIDPRPVSP
jgi:hypothetical protein